MKQAGSTEEQEKYPELFKKAKLKITEDSLKLHYKCMKKLSAIKKENGAIVYKNYSRAGQTIAVILLKYNTECFI